MKVFARKVLHLSSRVPKEDIENEARVIDSIIKNGGHKNIIAIMDHGWLKGRFGVYFIDMELADWTLADYVDYLDKDQPSALDIDKMISEDAVFVHRGCSFQERIRNMWTIGSHIVGGLEFMHFHGHAHRDLKPSNGSTLFLPQFVRC